MTTEEKAKAYDEAIKRGLDYIRHTPATEMVTRQDIFEAIFPEFKESEDEKTVKFIKKQLFNIKKTITENCELDVKLTKAIDWLEKQDNEPKWCHHKVDLSDCSDEYRKAYYDGWNNCNMQHSQRLSDSNNIVKCLINGMKFFYEGNEEAIWGTEKFSMKVKDIIAWLERQYEQPKKVPIWKHWKNGIAGNGEGESIYLIKYGHTYSLSSCLCFECDYIELSELDKLLSEKQGETSPILSNSSNIGKNEDKIEPKFKVGDWVIDKQGILHQIANVVENVTCHTYGYDIVGGGYFNDNTEGVRLWTIEDAKEGDVLCDYHEAYNNPLIFVLKKFEHVNFGLVRPSDYSSYCYLTAGDSQRFKEGTYHHKHSIKPATKEQRDLLFQKMKEAGYEWDTEKKELKKLTK